MLVIYSAVDITEAGLIRGLLEVNGIKVQMTGDYLAGAVGELPAWDYIYLKIHEADLERAEYLLQEYHAGELELTERDSEATESPDPDSIEA